VGELGAGFAIVAGEVRNLALKTAAAAQSTSEIITNISVKITQGGETAQAASGLFRELEQEIIKVGSIITEISRATSEQAQSTEQIRNAVSRIESVVQANAAGAEESASGSGQLAEEARHLLEVVAALTKLM
jgi:methyl-accepting chemotaxis protein